MNTQGNSGGRTQRNSRPGTPFRQRGIVAILATISMLALLGMSALAIDGGHLIWGKTRLQNALDSAALSAAKITDDGGTQAEARAAAAAAFQATASGGGNRELADELAAGNITLVTEFSNTINPFEPTGAAGAPYVRVTVENMPVQSILAGALGINQKLASGSAVSGPSPALTGSACDVAPMMACGDPASADNFFGYTLGDVQVMKLGSNTGDVGPGNFQLARLDGNSGGSDIREAMAGNYEGCLTTDPSEPAHTEPGNTVGPTGQGLNHRFNIHQGPSVTDPFNAPDLYTTYPAPTLNYDDGSDTITGNGQTIVTADDLRSAYATDYSYTGYQAAYAANTQWAQAQYAENFQRRIITIPIVNCSGTTNGAGTVPVFGFACFFLIQPVPTTGPAANRVVLGEFIEDCTSFGTFTMNPPAPGTGPWADRIILYKDVARVDT